MQLVPDRFFIKKRGKDLTKNWFLQRPTMAWNGRQLKQSQSVRLNRIENKI